MTYLQLSDLYKSYGDVTAVAAVNLSIPQGSRTAIVGPSGSGKTTLLRLIAGFERPDAGGIALDGKVLADTDAFVPGHLRGIGVVAQEGALFPHLDVADNIAFGLDGPKAERTRRILELLDMVGLDAGMRTRKPDELSGGQQQRVALARALARKPRLMLLDEPFSALDTGLRAATRKAVSEVLNATGMTAILVTHDQSEALAFADQLGVMRDARLVQVGPPRDLYLKPDDPFTASFLGDAIVLTAMLSSGRASCAFGSLAVDDVSRAGLAQIMLRPEQLTATKADGSAPTGPTMTGIVDHVEFCGGSYAVTIRLETDDAAGPDGMPVSFSLSLPSHDVVAPGDRIHIAITGKAHVFT